MKTGIQNKEMNVAIILENNYVDYAKVMLHTLFYHHLRRDVTVYVFTTGLNIDLIRMLEKIALTYQNRMEFIIIGSAVTDGFPQRGHWPKSVWNSVLIPFYLPDKVKRILYLDVDIVVNQPLDQIYDMELEGNCMAACEDLWMKCYRRGIGYRLQIFDDGFKYVNLGVNVIDVEQLRQRFPDSIDAVKEFCVANSSRMDFIDQDFYNIFCYGAIKYLDSTKYNYLCDASVSPTDKRKIVENTVSVIHYASNKPLRLEVLDVYGIIFWKYAHQFGLAKEIFKNMRENYLREQGKKTYYKLVRKSAKTIIFGQQKKKEKKIGRLKTNYQVLLKWMGFIASGKKISSYMEMHGFRNLAIYGAGDVGKVFADFVKKESCKVQFMIDKKLSGEYNGTIIKSSIEAHEQVDVIVVTAEYYFDEIEEDLKTKTQAHITSISQIIYEIG